MLQLKHVSKNYNNNQILNDINITLPSKGLISVVGVSGSGKSTLLNLIGGLDKTDEGDIIVNNKNITSFKERELDWYHDKYIGFIFQNYNLIEYLTVEENLKLITNKYEYILKKLNIYDLKDMKVSLLSGGEKQRVAIARGILKNPKILLCDEPTGALDNNNSIEIMNILKKLSKDMLVIVVTHDIKLAEEYSDKILTIEDGYIEPVDLGDRFNNITITKPKEKNVFDIIYNHLRNKKKRNSLISISFAIGLIALGFVLSISNGFKASLDNEEKNSLARYPIMISKSSYNIEDSLKDDFNNANDKVYSYNLTQVNNITKEYVNNLEDVNNYLDYKIFKYSIDDKIIITSLNDKFYDEYELLYGEKITDNNDVLLAIDEYNRINTYDLISIGLNNNDYDYKDLVGYSYNINKSKYTIKGIIKVKDDSILSDQVGIIYNNYNFINIIPDEIYLYPSNYDNKLLLINKLNEYSDIKYQDISTSIKSISNNIVDAISIVLIVFSVITLIVSSILISILTYINIMEYKHEIGIYKSIGMTLRNIKNIFYIENIFIILKSIIISLSFIDVTSILFNKLIYRATGLSNVIDLNRPIVLIVVIISLVLSILSSYIPIKNISKLKTVDILRNE